MRPCLVYCSVESQRPSIEGSATSTASDIVSGMYYGTTRIVEILKLQQMRAEVVYVNARLERVFPRKREDTLALLRAR